eukprot:SAG31_NODE_1881_length_7000_cov_9.045646_2_plen_174_part_00
MYVHRKATEWFTVQLLSKPKHHLSVHMLQLEIALVTEPDVLSDVTNATVLCDDVAVGSIDIMNILKDKKDIRNFHLPVREPFEDRRNTEQSPPTVMAEIVISVKALVRHYRLLYEYRPTPLHVVWCQHSSKWQLFYQLYVETGCRVGRRRWSTWLPRDCTIGHTAESIDLRNC